MLAAPYGLDLTAVPWQIPVIYYSRPLTRLWGEVSAYNALLLLHVVCSGLGMYWLARYLTHDRRAAFVSGLIYAFSPYLVTHASYGHLSLAEMEWLPLYLWSLLWLQARPTMVRAGLSGVLFAVLTLENYYYGYFMTIATVVFVLLVMAWNVWREHRLCLGLWVRSLALMTFVAVLVGLPVIFPLLGHVVETFISSNVAALGTGYGYVHSLSELKSFAIRWWYYVLPPVQHPLLGRISAALAGSVEWGGEFNLYLGWTPLLLAGGAVVVGRRCTPRRSAFPVLFLATLAAVALLFSAPPFIVVGNLRIPMPSSFLFPLLPMFRAYCRFGGIAMLAVAALAGMGAAFVLGKVRAGWEQTGLVALICIGVLIEFLPVPPVRAVSWQIPPAYLWLARQPGEFIIAEYPLEPSSYEIRYYWYQFFQRVHQRPMVNGATPGSPLDWLRLGMADLHGPDVPRTLSTLGVRSLVVHEDGYVNREKLIEPLPVLPIPGLRQACSFPGVRILEVQASPLDHVGVLYPLVGQHRKGGFYLPERWKDGQEWRWVKKEANVVLFNPHHDEVRVAVHMVAATLRGQFAVQVALNGDPLGEWIVGEQPVELTLPYMILTPGVNLVHLVAPGEVMYIDGQAVSVALRAVEVEERPWVFDVPAVELVRHDSFGGEMKLVGVEWPDGESAVGVGKIVRVTLWWQAVRDMQRDYTVSLQLLDEAGIVAQTDRQALAGVYPTSRWQPGEVVSDTMAIVVPESVLPGEYPLILVVYHWPSMERLQVEGVEEDWVELQWLHIVE